MFGEIVKKGSCPKNPVNGRGEVLIYKHYKDNYGEKALERDIEKFREVWSGRSSRRTGRVGGVS